MATSFHNMLMVASCLPSALAVFDSLAIEIREIRSRIGIFSGASWMMNLLTQKFPSFRAALLQIKPRVPLFPCVALGMEVAIATLPRSLVHSLSTRSPRSIEFGLQ